ncbi:MAG: phage minor head protein [Salinivirgaceae bacterium]|nr:phage minor head protein [Salinivirgaceae bacterium]
MENYYNQGGCPIHGHMQLAKKPNVPKSGIDQEQFNTIAKTIKAETLIQPDLFNFTRNNLNAAVQKVYGNPKYDTPEFAFMQKLLRNSARFAGYKTAWQTEHIKQAVKEEQLAAINKSYNHNYMQAEYVHAVGSARAAKNWQNYEQDADLYPALEYMPSTAATPRSEHMKFYGVIKDLTDPFWDTWMPPSDWGCQCSVQQRRSSKGSKPEPEEVTLPPKAMRNNPGKTAELFTNGHPMIGKLAKEDRAVIDREYGRLERKAIRNEAIESTSGLIDKQLLLGGNKVGFTRSGLQKAINQPHKNDIIKNTFITQLDEIFKNAKYVKSIDPVPKRKQTLSKTHIYSFDVMGEKNYILIWEYRGTGKMIFHSIVDKIKSSN